MSLASSVDRRLNRRRQMVIIDLRENWEEMAKLANYGLIEVRLERSVDEVSAHDLFVVFFSLL